MNCYPSDFEIKLGFDQIRLRLKNYSYGPLGIGQVDAMLFLDDYNKVLPLLQQTLECKKLIEHGTDTLFRQYADIRSYFPALRVEGSFLEEEQFVDLIKGVQTIFSLFRLFENNAETDHRL